MKVESKKNLIICLTPLQMLIASRIVEKEPAVYDFLCLSYDENEKYDYYYEKLGQHCDKSYKFIVRSNSKIGRLFDFLKFKFFLKNIVKTPYENVYLASIDNPFLHMLLSALHKVRIRTFDDGSANIYKDSIYYKYAKKNFIQYSILGALGNFYSVSKIVSESEKHFTIYRGQDNITKNLVYLSLFNVLENIKANKEINIFLGQPFNELGFTDSNRVVSLLVKIGIEYYFPHPREREIYSDFSYIKTPMIFEDYVLTLLEQGYVVNIYSFLSTAALNVASICNVHVYVLYDEKIAQKYSGFYTLLNSLNCKLCEF